MTFVLMIQVKDSTTDTLYMKIYLIILFILSSTFVHAQDGVENFRKKLAYAKNYRESVLDKEKKIENLINNIKSYKNKNMISLDQKILEESVNHLEAQLKKIKKSTASLYSGSLEKKIDQLEDLKLFKNNYEKKQKRMKTIQKTPGTSKRFKNYIKSTLDKKYMKADLFKKSLFKQEKMNASEFEHLNNYIVRQENIYNYNNDKIITLSKKIEKSMTYPEESIQQIDEAMLITNKEMKRFMAVKNDHTKVQYDVTISEWESGLFNCKKESKAKLMRYKNFPNFIALTTKGNVRSILNVSADHPNTKDFVYKCSSFSMFGSCKENTKKEICKIQDECASALEKMENSFDNNKEFLKLKNKYMAYLLSQRKKSINEHKSLDILDEWDKNGQLGKIQKNEFDNIFSQMREYAAKNQFLSSKDLTKKMKVKINKNKFKLLKKYKNDEQTQRAIEYSHNNMISFFESLQNRDKFQSFVATTCSSGEFCSRYQAWLKAASIFDEMEEVDNLTKEECPRIVLRFNSRKQVQNGYSCDRAIGNIDFQNMNSLNTDSKKILNKIK